MKRLGILGGTFDPPHNGHIAIAEQAKKQLGLDCVYLVPAYIPPHKQPHSSTTAQQRMNMLKLAVRGKKELKVSSVELKRRGISYTIDTLNIFKKRFPAEELILIIGADNLIQFHSWKSPELILHLASLAVYKRKGFNRIAKVYSNDFVLLKGRLLPVSSTDIRNKIEMGLPIQDLVPKSIYRYIQQHSLYTKKAHIPSRKQDYENHRLG